MTERNERPNRTARENRVESPAKRPILNVVLWIVQVLLALLFLFAGGAKLVLPAEALKGPIPVLFLRFIGVCEAVGGLGLILPGVLRIRQGLTPLAAAGLAIIMIGATVVNLISGSAPTALITLALLLLATFVSYGRRQAWRRREFKSSGNANSGYRALPTS